MIIIEVKFESSKKTYKYLLVNPGKYKIDKKKPLICEYGSFMGKPMVKNLEAVKAYKVAKLPDIVTSQIVLLDNNNNISMGKIGLVTTIEVKTKKPSDKITSKPIKRVFKDDALQKMYEESLRKVKKMNSVSIKEQAEFIVSIF